MTLGPVRRKESGSGSQSDNAPGWGNEVPRSNNTSALNLLSLLGPKINTTFFVLVYSSRAMTNVTLSKKESRTKVAKNCTKSLYSQVSVKIFDKVKQSHLLVSQSQLKLGEKSPKKKP